MTPCLAQMQQPQGREAETVLDPKVFLGPARVMAGSQDEASVGLPPLAIADDGRHCRG
jgi:hypothetical protein